MLEALARTAEDFPQVSIDDFEAYCGNPRHPSARFYKVYPYLKSKCPDVDTKKYFTWRNVYNADEICRLISDADGFAVLAHPGWSFGGCDDDHLMGILLELKDAGITGIECFHPTHNGDMGVLLENWSVGHNVMITGGSDYHGESHSSNNRLMGYPVDKLSINPLLERI